MPKSANRAFSRYSRDATELLGQLTRRARLQHKMTAAELAERTGVSRGLIQRIEQGDPGCAIGTVFEVAAIVGVRLFDADQSRLTTMIGDNKATLALLPRAARAPKAEVKDDF
jgi:transcriptional regulator with XRE-family HTH domain